LDKLPNRECKDEQCALARAHPVTSRVAPGGG
jgi:hypothetical protein